MAPVGQTLLVTGPGVSTRFGARGGRLSVSQCAEDVPGEPTVLLVGTHDWAIEQSAAELEAAGCRVLRCHEPGEPTFPCNALIEGRTCPLDVGFDVVATVRARALSALTQPEFGVVCALHAGAPLVVAGVASERPFGPWTALTVEQDGDVVSACRTAVAETAANRSRQGAS